MYKFLSRQRWDQVLRATRGSWPAPKTVHLPIQPVHSPDFIYVDSAFNAYRLRVVPGLLKSDPEQCLAARNQETFLLGFAFDDPPFIPDFRCSEMSLAGGRWPVVTSTYFAWDIFYQLEYFCLPLDREQSLLCVTGRVRNEDDRVRRGTVRVRLDFQPESDFFPYHYVPFYWDISRWQPHGSLESDGALLLRHGQPVGGITEGGFELAHEPRDTVFQDQDYNLEFGCSRPYHVAPAFRLRHPGDTMRLSASLEPEEEREFQVLMLTNYEKVTARHREALKNGDQSQRRRLAMNGFRRALPATTARLACPADKLGDIFSFLCLNTRQLLVRHPGQKDLMPVQGGSTERHFVWVWEAVCTLVPLLKAGHFKPVRETLDFIFKLQDAGCPPIGQFTDTDGAVGTTGPRWMCTTGSALGLASEYYRYTASEDFLAVYLPRILKAGHWIIRQLQSTRRLAADGRRPLTYGLMPAGRATDGDYGHVPAKNDAWTFWGFEKTVLLLEETAHEEAAFFRAELERYHQDLNLMIEAIARPDGYIPRKIDTGEEEIIARKFENTCNSVNLAFTGVIDPKTRVFRNFQRYVENNVADWFFLGRMDREVVYIGNSEWQWHDVFLRRGEWKKAFAALQANLQYGMTRDTHVSQERFSRRNAAFAPWQPNASANGRFLDMIIKSFYLDLGSEAVVVGCIPFAWLQENRVTELKNLHTPAGILDLRIKSEGNDTCCLTLTAHKPGVFPSRLRFPPHFIVAPKSPVKPAGENTFRLPGDPRELIFSLRDAERSGN